MKKQKSWRNYENRLSRVFEHVQYHLDDDLDMDKLAQIACLSPYHWHRIYRSIYGETIITTVKRLRMNRSAAELLKFELAIPKIAIRAGYPNVQSFNRTFKKHFGVPPGKYREIGAGVNFGERKSGENGDMFKVEVKDVNPITMVGLPHQGTYDLVGITFEKLNGLATMRGINPRKSRSVGIYYDDPSITHSSQCRAFAGFELSQEISIQEPLEKLQIAGGKYAIFHFQGPYANMEACYQWIYDDWLANSDCTVRDEPGFTEYINPFETNPGNLQSDIYLPLV